MVKFKFNSGTETSSLPLKLFNKINIHSHKNQQVLAFGDKKFRIKSIGTDSLYRKRETNSSIPSFIIVEEDVRPLEGLQECIKLNILKRME